MIEVPNTKMMIGVVEDVNDPEQMGRVRVRVYGFHTEFKEVLPTDMLRWYSCLMNNSAATSGIGHSPTGYVQGSTVMGFFLDPDCQNAMVMGALPGKPEQYANMVMGFNDPDGMYPRFIDEPDVNRLARDGEPHQLRELREHNRILDIQGPLRMGTWEEPPYINEAQYPKNHVHESESGHIHEIDDTPGNERLHEYHRTGTYKEINAQGDQVVKVVGDGYEIIAGDKYMNVRGTCHVTFESNVQTYIKGDYLMQIDGNKREVVLGSVEEYYKDQRIEVKGTQDTHAGNSKVNAGIHDVQAGIINLNEG